MIPLFLLPKLLYITEKPSKVLLKSKRGFCKNHACFGEKVREVFSCLLLELELILVVEARKIQ